MDNFFTFEMPFKHWSLDEFFSSFDPFNIIDFSILYSWLPSDIVSTIRICLTCLFVLAVVGLLGKLLDAIPFV